VIPCSQKLDDICFLSGAKKCDIVCPKKSGAIGLEKSSEAVFFWSGFRSLYDDIWWIHRLANRLRSDELTHKTPRSNSEWDLKQLKGLRASGSRKSMEHSSSFYFF
jgi:hypothetical protein